MDELRGLITQLVPNHLSTQKTTNPHPPYHTLNPQNHQKNTPIIKKQPDQRVEKEKRGVEAGGSRVEMSERGGKEGVGIGVERCKWGAL